MFDGTLDGSSVRVLIGSGASSIYVSKSLLKNGSLTTHQVSPRDVRTANGQVETCDTVDRGHLQLGNFRRDISAYAITLRSFDLILGLFWRPKFALRVNSATDTYTMKVKGKTYRLHPSGSSDAVASVAAVEEAGKPAEEKEQRAVGEQLKNEGRRVIRTSSGRPSPIRRSASGRAISRPATPIRSESGPSAYSAGIQGDISVRQGLLRDGIIEPSDSPWLFPPLLVKKADGTLRVCIDFRQLNKVTRKNAHPLPRIDDGYQFWQRARFFATLDLKSGYWQVQLTPSTAPKTAFTSRAGHFHFKVMPFGLTNAQATFQKMMNEILAPFIDRFVLVYLDGRTKSSSRNGATKNSENKKPNYSAAKWPRASDSGSST
ncbi:hypothetical protein JCM8202_000256 [Rhodotorula sphaerocarpa]